MPQGFLGAGQAVIATTQWLAILSVKAPLGCFTRRREDAKVGGRASPRAAPFER